MEMTITSVELPEGDHWISEFKAAAYSNVKHYGNCAQSILSAFLKQLGIHNPSLVASAGSMQGGMLSSLTCGVHASAMMILGILMGRAEVEQGFDAMFPIIAPAQELISRLNTRVGGHSCLALTGVDFTDQKAALRYAMSPEHEKCLQRVADGAETIGSFLNELNEKGELFKVTRGESDYQ